jgi:hypothetical protein
LKRPFTYNRGYQDAVNVRIAMYVLDYLAGKYGHPGDTGAIVTEYRLLCSGELYNGRVQTLGDWRKSDITRNLLSHPCILRVVSQPFDDYPQELLLRVSAPESVTETKGNSSLILRPDDDVAEDLASLLTLFLRRLITVSVKVRVTYPTNPMVPPDRESGPHDWPLPIVNSATRITWRKRPVSIGWGMSGVESFVDNNPPPLGVDPGRLESRLAAVVKIPHSEAYIRAAKLYAQAMRLIEEWPDVAYQRLVSSVETVAAEACSLPSRDTMLNNKAEVSRRAKEMGLGKEDAEELALLASKDNPWTSRKFRTFIKAMVDETLWQADKVFRVPDNFVPNRETFDDALSEVCKTRGAAVHAGVGYGASVGVGSSWGIPVEALHEALSGGPKVPPVTWFERVANMALNRYLDEASAHSSDWKISL